MNYLLIFSELFKTGWGVILKNKINRRMILVFIFQSMAFALLLLIDYGVSFFAHGNFFISRTVETVCIILGKSFIATPMMNVVTTLSFTLLSMVIIYAFLHKVIDKLKNENVSYKYNTETNEVEVFFKEGDKLRMSIQYIRSSIVFGTLLNLTVQLWLFNNLIYPNNLPKVFFIITLCCSLFTLLFSFLFVWELKEFTYSSAIQSVFEDEKSSELISILDTISRKGHLEIRGEEFFEELRNFVELEIIQVFPRITFEQLDLEKIYKLEISRNIKEEFEKEKKVRNI